MSSVSGRRGPSLKLRIIAPLLLPAMLTQALLLAMLNIWNLQHQVGNVVALLLATSIFYLVSVWWVLRPRPIPVWFIIGAGLVFRLTVFPLPPSFSDDLYRYRWEGRLQAEGGNPYLTPPREAPRDSTYPMVDGKDFRAVYGPLTEIEERLAYRAIAAFVRDPARQVYWFKLPSALADLGTAMAIICFLRARGIAAERVLIYFWCPLPIFVFWGMGHNDSIVILFIALTLMSAARASPRTAYFWLSFAAAAKIWPLALFPSITGWRARPVATAAAVLAGVAAAVSLPFGWAIFANRDFASGFLGGWRNNDSIFGLVLSLVGDPYRAKHITFALTAAAAIAISALRWPLERKLLAVTAAVLAFSSNVHPWYLTWMLPMLTAEPFLPLLVGICVVPVFYEPVIAWTLLHEWQGVHQTRWLVYGAVGLLGILWLIRRRSLSSNTRFVMVAAQKQQTGPRV
jgi:hypothetical protein